LGDVAPKFSEGLAAVSFKNKYGFINRRGKLVLPAIFDGAGSFAEGLAPAAAGRRRVLIDKNGKVVKEFPPGKASGGKRKSSE
jgi:hypothetical protein